MSDTIIHVLPTALCNQIAAGEVLERAASAVKELIENSLDAGATTIEVEIDDGGKKRLCVTDNGCGMTAEDARLSVIRHATSKISTVEDLAKIGTMGFRGEALASMAAVSKLTILTKRACDDAGTCLKIEGAQEISCTAAAAPDGTQILLEDLFFNTPARLKFLKSTATEQRRVYEVIEQFALACYEVSFKLVIDGRVKCDFPKNRTLRERAHAVLGRALYDHLYDIEPCILGSVRVDGVFCAPDYIQSAAGRIFMYVNGRTVKDKTILSAINKAYQEFLHGKQPCVILFVTLPLDLVDVNVHPTKHEIRFQDQDAVFRAVYRAVRGSLEKAPWIQSVAMPLPSEQLEKQIQSTYADIGDVPTPDIFEAKRPSTVSQVGAPFSQRDIATFQQLPDSSFDSPERQQRAHFGVPDPSRFPTQRTPNADACQSTGLAFCDDEDDFEDLTKTTTPQTTPKPSDQPTPPQESWHPELKLTSPGTMQAHISEAMGDAPCLPLDMPQTQGYFSSLRFVGQIALTYLLCEDNGSLVVVDQHAAHERINYEKLKRIADKFDKPIPQGLLFPLLMPLDPRLADVFREYTDFFESLGFQIDAISDNSFAIRAVPDILVGYDYQSMIRDALVDLAEQGRASQFEQLRDDIIATMACHKSIRAGRKMSAEDAYKLFREMDQTAFRSNCPHGRPVHFVLTRAEIEKRFLRVGFDQTTPLIT